MTVSCTLCSSRYVLPPHLLGPHGARVRCPVCGQAFVVMPDGTIPGDRAVEPAWAGHGAGSEPWGRAGSSPAPPATPAPGEPQRVTPARTHVQASPEEAASRAATGPRLLAIELIRKIDDPPRAVASAASRGRMFSVFGPMLLDAFDRCRREAGREGGVEFRRALADASGIDLEPPTPREP